MTNPLSSLSRYPRRPFKEKNFSKINEKLLNITGNCDVKLYEDFEIPNLDSGLDDLLKDVTTDIAKQNFSKYSKEMSKSYLQPQTGSYTARTSDQTNCKPLSHDYELMSKLMKRISQLELTQRFQEKELKEKNLRIKVLEDKCKLYQKTKEMYGNNSDKINKLEKECDRLQKQISEMENFLADYGLVWVGEDGLGCVGDSTETVLSNEMDGSLDIALDNFTVNYDKILTNIDELNQLVKSDESVVTLTGPQRVELKKKQSVSLTLYANGISLFSGPFRPFSDKSTRVVLQDIVDGYFPSELEERYPAGVPIQAIDRRNIFFDAKQVNVFQGSGKTLGGLSMTSKLLNDEKFNGNENTYVQPFTEIISSDSGSQMTVEQFLNKLPTSSISKDGRIMSIRNSIREIIENKPMVINKITQDSMTDPCDDRSATISAENLAQIKIRSINGENIYHVNMNANQCVRDLYEQVSNMSNMMVEDFVLVSALPTTKQLTEMDQTLEACGLIPNASLCMKLVK